LKAKLRGLTRKAVEKALAGDTVALKLCLERVCPPPKEAPIKIRLPKVKGAADIPAALNAIFAAAAKGILLPGEAKSLAALL
jgi:hypothetical protein